MWAMARTSDRVRAVLVAVMAVVQAAAAPLTRWTLGPASNTGAISDANISPVTPADYSFTVWGLIYAARLALAVSATAEPAAPYGPPVDGLVVVRRVHQ